MQIPRPTLFLIIGIIVGFDLLIAAGVYYWFVVREGDGQKQPPAVIQPENAVPQESKTE